MAQCSAMVIVGTACLWDMRREEKFEEETQDRLEEFQGIAIERGRRNAAQM